MYIYIFIFVIREAIQLYTGCHFRALEKDEMAKFTYICIYIYIIYWEFLCQFVM